MIIKEEEADEEKNLRLKGEFCRPLLNTWLLATKYVLLRLRTNDLHGKLAHANVFGYSCNARFDVINKYWALYKRFVDA